MLDVILQAKEAARPVDRRRDFPAAIVGNGGSGGGPPVRCAEVRREFETESGGRVRPGNEGIGIVVDDSEGNASARLAVAPGAQKNGRGQDGQV